MRKSFKAVCKLKTAVPYDAVPEALRAAAQGGGAPMIARLIAWLLGPSCPSCGERVRDDRLSLHWHIEHAGELR